MATGDLMVLSMKHRPKAAVVGDGTGDYIQIDAWGVAREAAGTADTVGTFAAWVNIKSNADSYSILAAGDTDAIEYINFQIVNGLLNITLADGGAVAFDIEADAIGILPNVWTHIAMVQDGVQPKLYINGVVIAATNDTATDITKWFADLNGIDNANIGILDMNTSTTLDLDGAIGYVKHWNAALTPVEIKAEYEGRGRTVDLISFWNWEQNTFAIDSVSAHNGTIVNNAYQDIQFSNLTAYIKSKAFVVADDISISVTNGNTYNIVRLEA